MVVIVPNIQERRFLLFLLHAVRAHLTSVDGGLAHGGPSCGGDNLVRLLLISLNRRILTITSVLSSPPLRNRTEKLTRLGLRHGRLGLPSRNFPKFTQNPSLELLLLLLGSLLLIRSLGPLFVLIEIFNIPIDDRHLFLKFCVGN